MEKKTTSEPSLPITNKYGKAKFNICNIANIDSNKRKSIITDKNGNPYDCPWSLKKIEKECKKYGLMIVRKGKMANLNYALEEKEFNIRFLKLATGKVFELSRRIRQELSKLFKLNKMKSWKDLLTVFSKS